jgi:hypothetical protein
LSNGKTIRHRLEDVIAATPAEIRSRFRKAAAAVIGDTRARQLEELVDSCEALADASLVAAQCRLEPSEQRLRSAS